MVHIFMEESYTGNNRAALVLDGISSVLRKKRVAYKIYNNPDDIPGDARIVVLICASLNFATSMIELFNSRGIHPLLFGFQYIDTMYQYSCITLTYTKTMYQLTNYIASDNPGKIAFLGYNSDSLPDKLKLIGVNHAAKELGYACRVFKSHGDVKACIEEFERECSDITNIVCSNDGVAMILRTYYKKLLEGRRMCSCAGLTLSGYIDDPHPTTVINYYEAGVRLAEMYLFLSKCEEISSTTMTIDMDIRIGGETISNKNFPIRSEIIYSNQSVDFYGDKYIMEVEDLDRMLIECDATDLVILDDIMSGKSYEQVAEERFLASNTVKYRIRAMLHNANVLSKKDLIALIRRYGLHFPENGTTKNE